MSKATNKQIIQQVLADIAEGKGDTFLSALAEDVVFEMPKYPVDVLKIESCYQGKERTLELLGLIDELFDTLVFEPRVFIAENDKVAVLLYEKARAKITGKEFEQEFVQIWTLRNGKIVHCKLSEDTYAIVEASRT